MTHHSDASPRRLPAWIVLACTALAAIGGLVPQIASAQTSYMRVDGIRPDSPSEQPLAPDAFPISGFELSVERPAMEISATGGAGAGKASFGGVNVNLSISGPALALWLLAAQGQVVARASLAVVDAKGLVSYRADLEQVMVKSLGMQTLNGRDAAVAVLSYGRARLSFGDAKSGTAVGWDQLENKLLK